MNDALLPGVTARTVETPWLITHFLENGIPVLFVHGNVSSSRFFEETLAALPDRYRGTRRTPETGRTPRRRGGG